MNNGAIGDAIGYAITDVFKLMFLSRLFKETLCLVGGYTIERCNDKESLIETLCRLVPTLIKKPETIIFKL